MLPMSSISANRFQKIVPVRRVEKVWEQLHEAIYCGVLKPGEILRETELSSDLGVSQATVREALGKLENLELVVRTPHKGTEVKNLTRDELSDRIAVRVSLETLACTSALNNWSEQDYKELEVLARAIRDTEDPAADLAFHRYIWNRCGNATLLRQLLQISACLFGFVTILRGAKLQNPEARFTSHMKFIHALRIRDGKNISIEEREGIRNAVREHLDSAYKEFFAREYPDFKSLAESLHQPVLVKNRRNDLLSLATVSN
jgi:DNA-binding GntR family transcriptional regulator